MFHYNYLVIDHEQVFVTCESFDIAAKMLAVRDLIDIGERDPEALQLLKPFVDANYPEALYLRAFVYGEDERSDDGVHYLDYLKKSADLKYPMALYEYGVHLDTGDLPDLVKQDETRAAELFEMAAELGHARCEWIHGSALLYGRSIYPKNENNGLDLYMKSSKKLFVEALESTARFYESGDFGFPCDVEKAKCYRDLKGAKNAILYP